MIIKATYKFGSLRELENASGFIPRKNADEALREMGYNPEFNPPINGLEIDDMLKPGVLYRVRLFWDAWGHRVPNKSEFHPDPGDLKRFKMLQEAALRRAALQWVNEALSEEVVEDWYLADLLVRIRAEMKQHAISPDETVCPERAAVVLERATAADYEWRAFLGNLARTPVGKKCQD